MNTSFHNLLLLDQTLFSRRLYRELADTNLTSGQPKILEYLLSNDGAMQKTIAAACHIEPASVTSLLRRMEENKLIERRSLNGNRRSLYVYLTPYGRKRAEHVKQTLKQLEEDVLASFTDAERTCLTQALYRIYQNLTQRETTHDNLSE